jgi:hypothetical protein
LVGFGFGASFGTFGSGAGAGAGAAWGSVPGGTFLALVFFLVDFFAIVTPPGNRLARME